MPHPLLDDPFVAAEIDRALAVHAAPLSPADREWAREQLAALLAENPEARDLLAAAHPRQVDESGERLRPGIVPPAVAAERGKTG